MCIRIAEQPTLQDWVCRGLDIGDEVTRAECALLDLRKIVLRILVEDEGADRAERELGVRPNLGEVKDVVAEGLGLLGCHGLDVDLPGRVIARLDGFEEVLDAVFGILTSDPGGGGSIQGLHSTIWLGVILPGWDGRTNLEAALGAEMDLSIDEAAIGLQPLEGMTRVSMHLVITVGGTTIREQDQ